MTPCITSLSSGIYVLYLLAAESTHGWSARKTAAMSCLKQIHFHINRAYKAKYIKKERGTSSKKFIVSNSGFCICNIHTYEVLAIPRDQCRSKPSHCITVLHKIGSLSISHQSYKQIEGCTLQEYSITAQATTACYIWRKRIAPSSVAYTLPRLHMCAYSLAVDR